MTTENYIAIRKALAQIIKGTEWEGHVYLVGGCVRDEIMGQEIHDIDLAVDIPNGGIKFACWLDKHNLTAKGRKPILFEHFGTSKFRLQMYPKDEIDCVQTRKAKYEFEEEPDPEMYFGTIEEDALCRDLTINTLFRNISTDALLDPLGVALNDIENHIIRTPNDPNISLRDNAMHILRCIRFAVKYDWRISPELLECMKQNIDIMSTATAYRIKKELIAVFKLKQKRRAFGLMSKVGAMKFVEPYFVLLQTPKPKPEERSDDKVTSRRKKRRKKRTKRTKKKED